MKQQVGIEQQFQEKLFSLVMDAITPWVFHGEVFQGEVSQGEAVKDIENRNLDNWRIRNVSMKDEQACICVMHVSRNEQYTALVCCLGEPEVVAVSYTDGNLGVLNPYLDSGHKLEADLDGPGCWNVLAITFRAEPGAQTLRFSRQGQISEVNVNEFGCFSIIDWNANRPIDEYLGVKVNGEWKKPVVGAIPYTINYVTACWRKAVFSDTGLRSRWNRWITAAFVELCGSDRAVLQREMMNTFADERNQICYQAFKQERRRFLNREKAPLEHDQVRLNQSDL